MTDWRRSMNWRDDLRRIVESIPSEQSADAIGELEAAKARLYARLMTPSTHGNPNGGKATEPDRLLNVKDAAAILEVKPRWMYRHADEYGATRLSRKCLRFSEARIRREAERRRRLKTPR